MLKYLFNDLIMLEFVGKAIYRDLTQFISSYVTTRQP